MSARQPYEEAFDGSYIGDVGGGYVSDVLGAGAAVVAGGATGTAEVNFGAFPGTNLATVAVSGQADILVTSTVRAWITQVATTDHTAEDHQFAAAILAVTTGTPRVGDGFDIVVTGPDETEGKISLAWEWI